MDTDVLKVKAVQVHPKHAGPRAYAPATTCMDCESECWYVSSVLVPEQVRKSVAFIGYRRADGEYRLAGSAFFLGHAELGATTATTVYLVTARHVSDAIRNLGLDTVQIRLNRKQGDCGWMTVPTSAWFTHPTDPTLDVAVTKCGIPDECDPLVIPYGMCVTDQVIHENEVNLGDEVFVVGLFRHHHGTRRNIPIVRVGNLASMGEERITTALGDMEAVLIEARSIGGLSGSPVFLNLGISRMIKGTVGFAAGAPRYWFFGLIHGHFDAESGHIDAANADSSLTPSRINTGIAIVVPYRKIDEVIRRFEQSPDPA
jgi:hypothetical protein